MMRVPMVLLLVVPTTPPTAALPNLSHPRHPTAHERRRGSHRPHRIWTRTRISQQPAMVRHRQPLARGDQRQRYRYVCCCGLHLCILCLHLLILSFHIVILSSHFVSFWFHKIFSSFHLIFVFQKQSQVLNSPSVMATVCVRCYMSSQEINLTYFNFSFARSPINAEALFPKSLLLKMMSQSTLP